MFSTEAALSDITSVDTKERMKDVDVLDIQDSEMDKSNIGTAALVTLSPAMHAGIVGHSVPL